MVFVGVGTLNVQLNNEQFLLFSQCFQNACFPGVSKGVIVWEWVKRPHAVKEHVYYFSWVVSEYRLYCTCMYYYLG